MIPAFIKDLILRWWTLPAQLTRAQLTRIERLLVTLSERIETMAHTLDDALENIRSQKTMIDSFSATLSALRAEVKAAAGNQAKIDAIFDAAEANKEALVAAQVENTEAAPQASSTGAVAE